MQSRVCVHVCVCECFACRPQRSAAVARHAKPVVFFHLPWLTAPKPSSWLPSESGPFSSISVFVSAKAPHLLFLPLSLYSCYFPPISFVSFGVITLFLSFLMPPFHKAGLILIVQIPKMKFAINQITRNLIF